MTSVFVPESLDDVAQSQSVVVPQDMSSPAQSKAAQPVAQPDTGWLQAMLQGMKNPVTGALTAGPIFGGMSGLAGKALEEADKLTQAAGYNVGGRVTDLGARLGLSPEVAAGGGVAANALTQFLPAALLGKGVGAVAKGPIQDIARATMQKALKPSADDLLKGKAARAIDTLLEKDVPLNAGGMAELSKQAYKLEQQIQGKLAMSPESISKGQVGMDLRELAKKFTLQANPQGDLATLKKVWSEFRSHPLLAGKTDIPVGLAQKIKQGTYKQIGDKAYGELATAEKESLKGVAKSISGQIGDKVPSVKPLMKEQSDLLNALSVSERRALQNLNNDPAGLAWIAANPKVAAGMLLDRSTAFKSYLARSLWANAESLPAGASTLATLLTSRSGQEEER